MQLEPDWIVASSTRPAANARAPGSLVPFVDPAIAPPMFEMFRATAERQGAAVAVADYAGEITYSSLLQAVEWLRDRITALDHSAANIAILLPADARYAVAVFATLAAGRSSILLDIGQPDERNRELIDHAGASLVIIADEASFVGGTDTKTLSLSRAFDMPLSEKRGVSKPAGLDLPAFLIPTSGSSGAPKLIVHSQRSILNRVRATHDAQQMVAHDRALTLSALSSLTGLTGLMFLLSGSSIELFDLKQRGLGVLVDTLSSGSITILRCAPSLLRMMTKLPDVRKAFAGLRGVGTFGEPLTRNDAATLLAILPPDCGLRTSYGSTEASGFSWFVDPAHVHDAIRVASGRLLPDTMAAVINEQGHSCKAGEAGELWIRSRYNAMGEWTDGVVSDERLKPHASADGSRVYRTGDLARFDLDGVFVVLGRTDRMLKINGQRIEPGEVEVALRRFTEVSFAEIIVQRRADHATMIAFVVPQNSAAPELLAILRARLRSILPSYMLPSRIILVDAIPLLPNGKVDTVALQRIADGEEAYA